MADWIIIVISTIYATNHDQTGCVLIAGLGSFALYSKVVSKNNQLYKFAVKNIFLSVICFGVMFTLPGHIYRMTDSTEMMIYLPEFKEWGFWMKVWKGYATTVSHVLFEYEPLPELFLLFVAVRGYVKNLFLKRFLVAFHI